MTANLARYVENMVSSPLNSLKSGMLCIIVFLVQVHPIDIGIRMVPVDDFYCVPAGQDH